MLDMAGFAEPGIPVLADPSTRQWDQFMELRAAGGTKFSVSKGGVVALTLGSVSAPSISFAGAPTTGFYAAAGGQIGFSTNGTESNRIDSTGAFVTIRPLRFGSAVASFDTVFQRDAANVLAQISGTDPQTWRLYNTFTDASNYERLATVAVAANDFKIIPEAAGTGTLRGLQLGVSGGKLGFYGSTAVTKPTALTAADASTVDAVYGAEESGVINNLRTRVGELETKLQALGLLT